MNAPPLSDEKKGPIARREECDYRLKALFGSEERQAFLNRSRDICDYMLPHASSLLCNSPSQADERWRHIFDTAATEALDISVAGHMTYATPIGVGWLSLALRNEPELAEVGEVKAFLAELSSRMISIAQQSNTEQDFQLLTRDCLAFGGAASVIDDDDIYTIWHHYVPVGDYAIGANFRGQVDTLYRELRITLRQAVDEFGLEKLCADSRHKYLLGARHWDDPITIVQAIEPRPGGKRFDDDGKPMPALQMPWRSIYWEKDSKKDDGVLRESGYRVFPVLAPRYSTQGRGLYGYGPGCVALSHVRSLQHRHHRLAEVIDWKSKGLFTAPTTASGQANQWRPGGRVLVDSPNPQPIRNVVDNNADINHLLMDIQDVREQIRRVLHADTFTLLSSIDAKNVTAEAVLQKKQEKFDILGPLTARLLNEMPRPWVDITYAAMEAKRLIPPVPQVLLERRAQVDPEFESVLAKSAKSQKLASLSGFTGFVANVAAGIDKRALHKIKAFGLVNEAAKTFDISQDALRSDDEAQRIADAEAQAQAAADEIAMGAQRAQTVRDIGSVSTSEPNLVSDSLRRGA